MYIVLSALAVLIFLLLFAYFTDPFSRYTLVRRTYRAEMKRGVIDAIDENNLLVIRQALPRRILAVLKNGIHIVSTRWHKSPASTGTTVDEIIEDIYDLRFDPAKLLLTSGDHFSALFVRNLGVFYYPVLDTHIPASQSRWRDRQLVYLQTVAYALGVFAKHDTLTTTIIPTGRHAATCVNFYAYPSDTLYGILYALTALLGKEKARPYTYGARKHPLDTTTAAEILLDTYRDSLQFHYEQYRKKVFDEKALRIKTSLHMSGAKDITKRNSAFYDNVIFWKATELMDTLNLIPHNPKFLKSLKASILSQFWLSGTGHFLEDLSDEAKQHDYYSSDWLIVLATGFLSPERDDERHYFEQSVSYIQKHKIDKPFAIKYHTDTRAHRQFLAVRLAVASYGGDSIWSFWGMEYIKVLLALYRATGEVSFKNTADYHIRKYEKAILENNGFPEVYDTDGKLLETKLYRSIRQTGWVIGFDQVREIRKTIDE